MAPTKLILLLLPVALAQAAPLLACGAFVVESPQPAEEPLEEPSTEPPACSFAHPPAWPSSRVR